MSGVLTGPKFKLLVLALACSTTLQSVGAEESIAPRMVPVVKNLSPLEAQPFDLAQVRLLDSAFKQAMEKDQEYLLHFDPKRFLVWYQKHAESTSAHVWHHVASSYDGTTLRVYVDGKLVQERQPGALDFKESSLLVGMDAYGQKRFFTGTIDRLAVWNAALDPAAIAQLAAARPGTAPVAWPTPPLVSGGPWELNGTKGVVLEKKLPITGNQPWSYATWMKSNPDGVNNDACVLCWGEAGTHHANFLYYTPGSSIISGFWGDDHKITEGIVAKGGVVDPWLGWKHGYMGAGAAQWGIGHYLSACAAMYRASGNPKFLERVNLIVDELAKYQQVDGNAGLMIEASQKKRYAEIAAGNVRADGKAGLNSMFVPLYGYHKPMAGLLDAYELCGNTKARDVLLTMVDWCETLVKNLDETKMQALLSVEHGGMAETLAHVYGFTGEPRHLALAKRFRHNEFFDPIAAGTDMLSARHANTQVPKFVGYQRIHELTGDPQYGAAAGNFWNFVVHDRSFANGGNSLSEHFNPLDKFEDAMHKTEGPETCNTYNMLKLTSRLFAEKVDATKMDFYERALYNQILPSQHPKVGGFTYFQALLPGGFRTYMDVDYCFHCCVGTGMENHALYGRDIYSYKTDRLWVNLFIPSELNWSQQGAHLTQTTTFPAEPRTKLQIHLAAPKTFTVAVRYPSWVAPGELKLSVNGQAVATDAKPGTYAEVTRPWKDGDALSVELPMKIHSEMLPNSNNYAAVFYGPILLAANLGSKGLSEGDFRDRTCMTAKNKLPVAQIPTIVVPVAEIPAHLEPVAGKSLEFKATGLLKPADLTLVPANTIFDERYSLYFRLTSMATWAEDAKRWTAEEQHERELTALTVDELHVGEPQPEIDHKIKSERSKTSVRTSVGQAYREAGDTGWFSYELKVDPATPMQLLCTYWGEDTGRHEFDILVDGTVVASENFTGEKVSNFIEKTYLIPAALTKGKSVVSVKFFAKRHKIVGGIYNCRILKVN